MANVRAADLQTKVLHMAEYGNAISEDYGPVAATGVLTGEKVYLGVIPAGSRINDVRVVTSGSLGAGTTLSLGYEPFSGSSPAANGTYWMNAVASTAALNSQSAALPVTFDLPVYLVATVGGGNVTGSPTITAILGGKALGAK